MQRFCTQRIHGGLYLPCGVYLFVEEILFSGLLKGVEVRAPAIHNFLWSRASLQLANGLRIPHKKHKFLWVKFSWIESLENRRNLNSHAHRAHSLSIRDAHRNSSATLSGI